MILSRRMSRIAAMAFGLTFYVTAGMDVLGLHECPHHDVVAGMEGHGQGAHAEHAADPAAHGAHAATTDVASAPAHHGGHEEGPCTCVGTCQLGNQALPALAGAATTTKLLAPAWSTESLTGGDDERLPGAPPFFLPLANAPPGLGAQSV